MSLAGRIRAIYKSQFGKFETIKIRRYYGSGSPRSKYERDCFGREIDYKPDELTGSVMQGDWMIILLAEDLETGAVTLPLLTSDKAVSRGKEVAIVGINDKKRRVGGILCAYELQVRG